MSIKELRRLAGKTQVQIAAELGVEQSYYSRVERGKSNPTFQIVIDLSRSLDRPIGEVAEALANDLRSATRTIPGLLCRLVPNSGRSTTFRRTGTDSVLLSAVPA